MNSPTSTLPAPRTGFANKMWLVAGGLALTALGLAAGLAWRPAPHDDLLPPSSLEATRASLADNETLVESQPKLADKSTAREGTPVPAGDSRSANKAAPATPAPARPLAAAALPHTSTSGTTAPAAAPPVVCHQCGVVEAVRQVKVKGKGTGLGAVAGGVVGGAVGNQVGKGSGRTAMTVLGAIGGGLAGNEIEKHARSETQFEVRVRMDDGTLRTLRQKTAPALGSHVLVDGSSLRVMRASGGSSGAAANASAGA